MECYLDPTLQYPTTEPTTHIGRNRAMEILEQVFNPRGSHVSIFKDCVLVSLDLEYDTSARRILQVGLATLDTRDIHKADEDVFPNLIPSRLLSLGRQNKTRPSYIFGQTEKLARKAQIRGMVLSHLTIPDSDSKSPTKLRNIILVGHGIRADIRELSVSQSCNILELPTIKAVLDTSPLLNKIFLIPGHHHSLRQTCKYLGMYRQNIHNAGNDAMYTLKALLLLFCHYKDQKLSLQVHDDESDDNVLLWRCQVDGIRKIGRCKNGIDRYWRKRRCRLPRGPDHINNRGRNADLLEADFEGDEDLMGGLFDDVS